MFAITEGGALALGVSIVDQNIGAAVFLFDLRDARDYLIFFDDIHLERYAAQLLEIIHLLCLKK